MRGAFLLASFVALQGTAVAVTAVMYGGGLYDPIKYTSTQHWATLCPLYPPLSPAGTAGSLQGFRGTDKSVIVRPPQQQVTALLSGPIYFPKKHFKERRPGPTNPAPG